MKRTVWLWELLGFALSALMGTILHFLYEWFDEAVFIAPFSGVNESTWEHMKLLFWPMLAYALFESLFFKDYAGFWSVKLRGILLGLILIPIIFYMYNGVIGKSPDFVNISIFFISAAAAYLYESIYLETDGLNYSSRGSLPAICVIALLFIVFTFNAPKINLFRDPLTGTYGI